MHDNWVRPNHEDFKDSSELRKLNFSGIRNNTLSGYREVWMAGQVVAEMKEAEAQAFPQRWHALYEQVFLLPVGSVEEK